MSCFEGKLVAEVPQVYCAIVMAKKMRLLLPSYIFCRSFQDLISSYLNFCFRPSAMEVIQRKHEVR